jgi:hypothetical protein
MFNLRLSFHVARRDLAMAYIELGDVASTSCDRGVAPRPKVPITLFLSRKAKRVAMTTSGLQKPADSGLTPRWEVQSIRVNVKAFACASNDWIASAKTFVCCPQTIATRIIGLASAGFRSCATLISADTQFKFFTAIQFQAEPRTAIHARVVPKRTRLLWLGVPGWTWHRVKRRPAKVQRPRDSQLGRRCAETSDDVIRRIS